MVSLRVSLVSICCMFSCIDVLGVILSYMYVIGIERLDLDIGDNKQLSLHLCYYLYIDSRYS